MSLSIPLPTTSNSMSLRYCPNEGCSPRTFHLGEKQDLLNKNLEERKYRREPGCPGTTCPYCGLDGEDNDFLHQKDIEYAKELVKQAAIVDFKNELSKAFGGPSGKKSISKGTTITTRGATQKVFKKPYVYREDLLRNLSCDNCNRGYGVYAIGLFCPDCGATNLTTHFSKEMALIKRQVEDASKYKDTDKEYWYRLAGNAHEDVLGAFEAYQKTLYKYLCNKSKPSLQSNDNESKVKSIGNSFQNIEKAQKLYSKLGINPFDCLTEDDTHLLFLYSQKRHIIGHNLGLVDEKYSSINQKESQDTPVNICEKEILNYLDICSKVISALEKHLT